jgi:cysteine synthase A
VAAAKGYAMTLVMPDTMTLERRSLLKAYGAELILTPGAEGMKGAVDKAEAMAKSDPKYFLAYQFENPANPEVHRRTTALEILEQVPELDAFVAGIGTGGTITGVGEVLAAKKPGTLVVAVEPESSPLLTKGTAGPNKIQGIGANFIPPILNRKSYQRVEDVSYDDAIAMARRLTREEGLFSGISTGAIVHAAIKVAVELGKGKTVVAVLCDTGERYLSHPLYAEIDGPGV